MSTAGAGDLDPRHLSVAAELEHAAERYFELFDFQAEDVAFLGRKPAVLIANDMGTGKTFEALARDKVIRDHNAQFRGSREGWVLPNTLVVAPLTTLVDPWFDTCDRFGLKCTVIDSKNRDGSYKEFIGSGASVFLVHWEALRLMPDLARKEWLHVIADECHRMKNRKTQQTQALKKIPARYKTAMSGTPVVNRPDEAWSVLNWLDKKQYSSFWAFFKRYVDYEMEYASGGQYQKIKGPKNVEELHAKLGPIMVRRRKEEVLKDLPDKYYTTEHVELSPKQRTAYEQMRKDMIAWVGEQQDRPLVAPVVIAKLVRLQQFAAAYMEDDGSGGWRMGEPSSKLDSLMERVEDSDEPIVVFSQFKQLVNLANERLARAGVPYITITGDVPPGDRGKAVQLFQTGARRIFTGTIGAGGVGITLTAASTVVFLDRGWSPALNLQAEDRLHRIGQTNAVQVIDYVARGTVDLGRMQRLEEKWEWIKALLGDK